MASIGGFFCSSVTDHQYQAAFELLHPVRSHQLPTPINEYEEEGRKIAEALRISIGTYFAAKMISDHVDSGWITGLLERISSDATESRGQADESLKMEAQSDHDITMDISAGGETSYGGMESVLDPPDELMAPS
jgi:hypothetical protein